MTTRVLVIKHGALGDVVRTAYLLPGLSKRLGGESRVDWITAPSAADLLRYNPYVDRVLTDAQERLPCYDWVISLDDEDDALRIASSTGAERLSGAYLADGKKLYTDDVRLWFDMGLLSRHGKGEADRLKKENGLSHAEIFSRMLDVSIEKPSFFNSTQRELRWSSLLSPSRGRVVGINPFAGARWTAKAIPLDVLTELVERLLAWSAGDISRIVIFSEHRQEEVRRTLGGAGLPLDAIVFPDTRESPLEFAAAVKALDYLISSDSLGLHFAIAQNKPNLSFYAPTSAAEIGTFGSGVKVVSGLPDYCNYSPTADNSDITTDRLMGALEEHWHDMGWTTQVAASRQVAASVAWMDS